MSRLSPLLLGAVLAFAGVSSAGAQDASPPTPAPSTPPPAIAAPTPKDQPKAPEAKPQPRPISATTAAMLAAGMPKYEPPKPEPEPEKPQGDLPDLRDTDKPQNEIVRLPKFVVRAAKPPIFREQDIYTSQGLADLAVKRYLSDFDYGLLNRVTLPLFGTSAESRALQQYAEDQRLSNMADLNATADAMSRGGDAAEGEYIKRAAQDTYMRSIDWGGPLPQH